MVDPLWSPRPGRVGKLTFLGSSYVGSWWHLQSSTFSYPGLVSRLLAYELSSLGLHVAVLDSIFGVDRETEVLGGKPYPSLIRTVISFSIASNDSSLPLFHLTSNDYFFFAIATRFLFGWQWRESNPGQRGLQESDALDH